MANTALQALPSVDYLARVPALSGFAEWVRVEAAREAIDRHRRLILEGRQTSGEKVVESAVLGCQMLTALGLPSAVNMTGIILHTGLGRARLSKRASSAVAIAAAEHVSLELDLDSGERGDRHSLAKKLLRSLTGCEDALVLNNCAGAVFLALKALCGGGGVMLSRGQMVEIGGSFRLPDIVRDSGCKLVEVGCTNKTKLSDFAKAAKEGVTCLLTCHPSNYRVLGFTGQPEPAELASLCREKGLVWIDDLGSGCLIDTAEFGLPAVRTAQLALREGAHVVLFSGDKLLGGPQAGIVLGKNEVVRAMAHHPLARALRPDKLALAGLCETLRHYCDGTWGQLPVWEAAGRSKESVREQCRRIVSVSGVSASVEPCEAFLGSGSVPGEGVSSYSVVLDHPRPDRLARRLRALPRPIVSRVSSGRLWLDPRTTTAEERRYVCKILTDL